MPKLPVILTAFANTPDNAYLAYLDAEHSQLQQILARVPSLRHVPLTGTQVDQLEVTLNQYREDLLAFHFGGHADGAQLYFKDAGGQVLGLAQLLALHPNLKLVFLNGCNTQSQAKPYLYEGGVMAVIASTCSVNDGEAKLIAEKFYDSLVRGNTLEQAFKRATGALKLQKKAIAGTEIKMVRGLELEDQEMEEIPWCLYFKEPESLKWRLPSTPIGERREVLKWMLFALVYTIIATGFILGAGVLPMSLFFVKLYLIAIPLIYYVVPLLASFVIKLSTKAMQILNGIYFVFYYSVLLTWKNNSGSEYPWWLFAIMVLLGLFQITLVVPLISKK
jgi:CHAT domain